MTQFIVNEREVGIYPDLWRAKQVLAYHRERDDMWDWRVEERDGAYWVVASYVPPDEPLLKMCVVCGEDEAGPSGHCRRCENSLREEREAPPYA